MSTTTPLESRFALKPMKFLAPLRGEKVDAVPDDGEYLGLEQLESWTGRLSDAPLEQMPEGGANVFRAGDILFGKLRPYLAKGWVADRAGYCSTESLVLSPSAADPRFVRYCLLSPEVVSAIDGSTYGSKMPRADWSFIGSVKFPAPPRAVQERIANFLDDKTVRIDALIAEKGQLLDRLGDLEEVHAYDLVTGGLSTTGSRASFSEPWLSRLPGHWKIGKLRHVARIGNGSTPKRDNESYWRDGSIPWLNSGSVNATRVREASDFVTELARQECHLPMVRAGSTLVALTGQGKTRGTAAITEIESTINQHLAYVSPFDNRVQDEFVWVALTGLYSVLRYISEGEGSTKGALTCEDLAQLRLPIPPLNEQAAIVATFHQRSGAVNTLRDHAEAHVARLQEYRAALVSAAVTGQIPV